MFDKKVLAYTDGAALGNPGQGGYGVVLKYKRRSQRAGERIPPYDEQQNGSARSDRRA